MLNEVYATLDSSLVPKYKQTKKILDYVHGFITIDNFYFKFIDTPQFQRLRDLYQLDTGNFVFHCANHSRLEHSFGTYYLTNKFINHLNEYQPFLNITKSNENSLLISALCHNLGHPPFSNAFTAFCKDNLQINFSHQEMSTKILHNILDTQGIDPDTSKENEQFDVKLIESIINNKRNNKQDNYINVYQQLVTNTSNGINADIFDYLRRDSYKFGFPQQSFEFQILLDNSLVIDNDICYRAQDAYSVYDLFMSKFLMSKKFYLHRVAKGIELMIKDVFIESNSYFNYLNYINDLGLYTKFNDSILNHIYRHKSKKLEKAKQILDNIYKRNFYTFVGEYDSTDLKKNFDTFNEETLLKYTSSKEEPLKKEEIRVLKLKLNLGENEKDPMDNVLFYDTNLNKIKYKSEEISHLLPHKYQENIIRVYLTTNNRQKLNSAQQALINYCKEIKTAPILYKSEKKNTGHILEYKFDSNLIRSSLDLFSKID